MPYYSQYSIAVDSIHLERSYNICALLYCILMSCTCTDKEPEIHIRNRSPYRIGLEAFQLQKKLTGPEIDRKLLDSVQYDPFEHNRMPIPVIVNSSLIEMMRLPSFDRYTLKEDQVLEYKPSFILSLECCPSTHYSYNPAPIEQIIDSAEECFEPTEANIDQVRHTKQSGGESFKEFWGIDDEIVS